MTDVNGIFHLVLTKLNRPPIDSRWIVRPCLFAALDDALGKKLTLISAPKLNRCCHSRNYRRRIICPTS